jgi:lipopolysaccharide biosynthesis glycosyltransferase
VMNLARWRQEDTAERILTYIKEHHEHIRFHDQDGLNAVLWNRWGEIDPRWNQMPQILQVPTAEESPFDRETFGRVRRDPFIIHYASADKPWRYGCRHPATARFFDYQDRTAFRGWRPSAGRQWVNDHMNWVLTRIQRVLCAFSRSRGGYDEGAR